MLFICPIHNRSAADLRQLLAVPVERPAAYFLAAYYIFDEEYATIEAQRQFVKQLNVLE